MVDGKNTKFDNDTQYLQNNLVQSSNIKQTAQHIANNDKLSNKLINSLKMEIKENTVPGSGSVCLKIMLISTRE